MPLILHAEKLCLMHQHGNNANNDQPGLSSQTDCTHSMYSWICYSLCLEGVLGLCVKATYRGRKEESHRDEQTWYMWERDGNTQWERKQQKMTDSKEGRMNVIVTTPNKKHGCTSELIMAPIPDLIYFCSACHIPFSKHLSLVPSVSIHFWQSRCPFPPPILHFTVLHLIIFTMLLFLTSRMVLYLGVFTKVALKCLSWQETKTQHWIGNHGTKLQNKLIRDQQNRNKSEIKSTKENRLIQV